MNRKRWVLMLCIAATAMAALAGCSPVTALNALTPTATYRKTSDIAYGADPRHKLDIYTPLRENAGKPFPVVVFFFGGNWNSGERSDYRFVGEALASRGIVAVIADYRLYPQVRYPAFLEDSAQAVAWAVRNVAQHGGDPSRLYVMGHSAGAYNAAMVALDKRWLAASGLSPSVLRGFIGLAGPYDFLPIQNTDTRPVFFYPDTPPSSQPISHASASAPRALLIASNSDSLVNPVRNTGGLANKLRGLGVDVNEVYFDSTSHTSLVGALAWPLRGLAPVLDTLDRFVNAAN